ncbi:oxidoreductase [Cryptococcus neoformans C23]|uniref:Oxidoreductase n=2 Tax=Cryptococcus neoformans TaxID=5207 RepID=A0A854QET5_CRYNE|nr:oxidoreductase [Cryptococcus neoformans var. grubii H99]AUB27130.1 oxidoreductase [Cryptococcus neoformans var. grubii]OWZ29453.1 oxidoreductase [Cryptococcus neoformans var. grubii AD2-60a]OWZ41318.1 oxidoreductase [Cryptococcus neoformans var. grubii C23]OWZ52388.1 oxidoreductase [Cryptococcus neoformans var. grubii 125.91]OXC82758.1 oxidoreductase [Cryptococcus neoformans var. grubii AD1-7a]OXG16047.1 oxidoreductase [Cryptococcus neoformans var. grubii Tu259-1]OXG29529.1 oxidoreductase|eukprot:XP_012051527.1 oxidoreductase [Cryptococcus neoformans var. grubii H99]
MPCLTIESTVNLRTGRKMPRLGLGSGGLKNQTAVDAVEHAMKVGYLMVDTAQQYENEREVGTGIKKSGVPRSQIFICTKWQPRPDGVVERPTPEQVCQEAHQSVLRLDQSGSGKEYLDLMLIHHPRPDPDGRAVHWKGLALAQKEGWVKDIGVSNFNVKHLEALPGPLPAVNQLELHPWCQQREIVDYCSKKGIVLQAFCPLVRIQKHKFEDPVIIKISKKHKRGVAHILLRWSLQKGFIPIPKASSAERIEANKDLYNFELDSEDMEELDGLDQGAAGRVSGIDPAHLPD